MDTGYVGSADGEFFSSEVYKTKEEARNNFPTFAGLNSGDKFYIGAVSQYVPKINGYDVLDRLYDDAFDEVGDVCSTWQENIEQPDVDKLEAHLTKAFNTWMEETGKKPNFCSVSEVEEFEVD